MSAAVSAVRTYGTGRRKEAVARVFLTPGTGRITVNDRTFEDYFPREALRLMIQSTFVAVNGVDQFDLRVTVKGGGIAGQAGAVRHGIARALEEHNPDLRPPLKHAGFLTRDSRMKERKKYGQRGARARFQFSKR
jgi:small subunit ribosomal protein S9